MELKFLFLGLKALLHDLLLRLYKFSLLTQQFKFVLIIFLLSYEYALHETIEDFFRLGVQRVYQVYRP